MTHETENEFSERSIPQTAGDFARWYGEHRIRWPQELRDLGYIAMLTLRLMDQPNFERSEAMVRMSKDALIAFAEAYAKHTGGK